MTRKPCPLCDTQMVKQPSAKWSAKYECPECNHWEYDHSAIKKDYLNRTKQNPESRNVREEYSNKEKV